MSTGFRLSAVILLTTILTAAPQQSRYQLKNGDTLAINTKIMLEAANVPIVGAVLNRRTFPIPDKIYRYL